MLSAKDLWNGIDFHINTTSKEKEGFILYTKNMIFQVIIFLFLVEVALKIINAYPYKVIYNIDFNTCDE